jgi:nucleolar protein 14
MTESGGEFETKYLNLISFYRRRPEVIQVQSLELEEDSERDEVALSTMFENPEGTEDKFVIRLLDLIKQIASNYKRLPAYTEMFIVVKPILEHLSREDNIMDEKIKKRLTECLEHLGSPDSTGSSEDSEVTTSKVSIAVKKKPFILPMIEPRIESWQDKHDKKNKNVTKKLAKKVTREFKGAQRELRKDNKFIKETWLKETIEKDDRRKRKVRELIGDLASQQKMFKKKSKR